MFKCKLKLFEHLVTWLCVSDTHQQQGLNQLYKIKLYSAEWGPLSQKKNRGKLIT